VGTESKKLYRYDYGDILDGITFSEESLQDDISTLDQRVTRVMSSKIIEEKNLTEAQKLELEQKVKAEQTSSYEGEELPNTGEAESTNYAAAGLLSIFGAALLFMSKKLKTDN
jgi:Gram positive anchor.